MPALNGYTLRRIKALSNGSPTATLKIAKRIPRTWQPFDNTFPYFASDYMTDETRSRIEDYQLIVEEVLGGMDTMILQLDGRLCRIEKALGLEAATNEEAVTCQIDALRKQVQQLRTELDAGMKLLFRQIAAK